MNDFFRFPHTPHVKWLGKGNPRNDKLLSPSEINDLLHTEVIIEEKIDGANLGISLDEQSSLRLQNRGNYLQMPFRGQFSRLNGWLEQHCNTISKQLTPGLIVFGEWCAARHSVGYTCLPDFFLLFDIYDLNAEKFWSVKRRNEWAEITGLKTVPCIHHGMATVKSLENKLAESMSCYRDGSMEGIVIRKDDDQWNQQRAKLVRADFTQGISEHWSNKVMEWNSVEYGKTIDDFKTC